MRFTDDLFMHISHFVIFHAKVYILKLASTTATKENVLHIRNICFKQIADVFSNNSGYVPHKYHIGSTLNFRGSSIVRNNYNQECKAPIISLRST